MALAPGIILCPPELVVPLSRALTIPTAMDLVTLADVQALVGHSPKETRAMDIRQHVEAELAKAALGGDTAQVAIALQMVLMLEKIEYRRVGTI